MIFRAMSGDDVDPVTALEALSNPHPWSVAQIAQELTLPHARMDVAVDGNGRIAAYLCTWRIVDELHIQNVATHPDFRRQGVAGQLLRHVAVRALKEGARVSLLEVRASNVGAQALYVQLGFRETGRRKGYYAPNGEDAVLMQASVADVTSSNRGHGRT